LNFVGLTGTAVLRDVTGSYDLPFAIAGSLLLPAAVASFLIRENKYSGKYHQAIETTSTSFTG